MNNYIGNYTPLYQIMSDYVQIIYYYKKLYIITKNYIQLRKIILNYIGL